MHKTHMNGFILGNQKAMARRIVAAEKAKREPDKPKRGSWWLDVPRDQWTAKCAEVFEDIQSSVEGQKNLRHWRTNTNQL